MHIRKQTVEAMDHFTFFILYYSIFSFLAISATNDLDSFLHGTFLLVPFVINFFLRRIARRFGVLVLLHAPFPILVGLVLSPFPATFWWVIMAIALAIHSIVFAFRGPPTEKAGFMAACCILIGGPGVVTALVGLSAAVYPALLTLAVVGRILLIRMVKMDVSLDTMYNTYNQPINKIMAFDYKLMLGLGAAFAIVAVVLYLAIFAPLSGLLVDNLPNPPQFELDAEGRGLFRDVRGEPTPPTGEDFRLQGQRSFWNSIGSIFFLITGIAMTIGIIYGAFIILRYLANRKTAKPELGIESCDLEDEREFILPRNDSRKKRRAVESSLHPIRRLFRDTAKKHIKMGVSIKKSDTPTDIAKRIVTEDINNLANEYAEVRYGEN